MPLTDTQKKSVRASMAAKNEKRQTALAAQVEFEAKRDRIAYELMEENRKAIADAKAAGKPLPDRLTWGELQGAAADKLNAPAKPKTEPAAPKPAAPKVDAPAN